MTRARRAGTPHDSRTRRQRRRHALLLVLIGSLFGCSLNGCSHYGFADTDDDAGSTRRAAVSVWTVAAPAHEALDQARLTRALTDAVGEHGVVARWAEDASQVSVRCSVSNVDVSGFDHALFALAEVDCRVGLRDEAPEQFHASGRYVAGDEAASGASRASVLATTRAALLEAAVIRALETVAVDIARYVRQEKR